MGSKTFFHIPRLGHSRDASSAVRILCHEIQTVTEDIIRNTKGRKSLYLTKLFQTSKFVQNEVEKLPFHSLPGLSQPLKEYKWILNAHRNTLSSESFHSGVTTGSCLRRIDNFIGHFKATLNKIPLQSHNQPVDISSNMMACGPSGLPYCFPQYLYDTPLESRTMHATPNYEPKFSWTKSFSCLFMQLLRKFQEYQDFELEFHSGCLLAPQIRGYAHTTYAYSSYAIWAKRSHQENLLPLHCHRLTSQLIYYFISPCSNAHAPSPLIFPPTTSFMKLQISSYLV
ncbi:hypothetical protein CPB84DRAFT_1462559 [Gymnopilus junonius]|uniref:Uncharacterized protein n=1 Tax=Gymnopilus junonius TaxID=109634 RepID=A0A9P5NKD1_GYMJU|nr:hypothetical protein CPB84DRAFT_1462559 [Gymnopilus junonius]